MLCRDGLVSSWGRLDCGAFSNNATTNFEDRPAELAQPSSPTIGLASNGYALSSILADGTVTSWGGSVGAAGTPTGVPSNVTNTSSAGFSRVVTVVSTDSAFAAIHECAECLLTLLVLVPHDLWLR